LGLEDPLSIPEIDIVDNRDIADAMKKLEQSEKSKIGHVLVTLRDSHSNDVRKPPTPPVN